MENIEIIDAHIKGKKQYVIGKDINNGTYHYFITGDYKIKWKDFFTIDVDNNINSIQAIKEYIDNIL